MAAPPDAFWSINVGQAALLVAFAGLFLNFRQSHRENKDRIENDAKDRQDVKTKVDTMYEWFQNYIIGGQWRGKQGDD